MMSMENTNWTKVDVNGTNVLVGWGADHAGAVRLVSAAHELYEALTRAASELELLYSFAINHGIPEAGIPPHVEARAALAKADGK